jgi:hypothetical protein
VFSPATIIKVMVIVKFIFWVIDYDGEVSIFFYSFNCKHREVI